MCSRQGGREGERVGCAVDKEGGWGAQCIRILPSRCSALHGNDNV